MSKIFFKSSCLSTLNGHAAQIRTNYEFNKDSIIPYPEDKDIGGKQTYWEISSLHCVPEKCEKQIFSLYMMASTVCALWLAAGRAIFSCMAWWPSLGSKRFRGAKSEEQGFRRFARAKNGKIAKIGRRKWGSGVKETLADKPLDFENLRSPPNEGRDWLG